MIKNAITIAIAKLPYFIEIVPKIINEIVLKFSTVLRIDSQTTLDISQTLIKYLSGVKITIPNYFFGFLNTSMTLVYIAIFAFMVPIITFYLLRDWEKIERYGEFLLKKMSSKSITNVVRNINKNLGSYIIGQITVCIILAALYTICLYFIGLKEYIFCGLFSGFMSFTPFLGPLIGFTSTAVIAIDQYTTMQYMLTAAIYVILPFVDSNYLTPKLIGARVGIQPFWILFSICATVSIIGISGVFISVPIAVVAATIYKDFIKNL
jgi:predicted PurR-regulated permease PerM